MIPHAKKNGVIEISRKELYLFLEKTYRNK